MPKNLALLLILSLCSAGLLQAQTPKVVASNPASSILKKKCQTDGTFTRQLC